MDRLHRQLPRGPGWCQRPRLAAAAVYVWLWRTRQRRPQVSRLRWQCRISGTNASYGGWIAAWTAIGLEDFLAEAPGLGRPLHQLVFGNKFDGLLQVHGLERHQANGVVSTRGAHVGELLFTHHVHVQVVVAGMLANHHALVDVDPGGDEKHSSILETIQRICGGGAVAAGNEGPAGPLRDLSL